MKAALYRHYDASGRLLYVGVSVSPFSRLAQHVSASFWYEDVARIELEWHETRAAAVRAEADVIRVERPAHNLHHQPPAKRAAIRKSGVGKWYVSAEPLRGFLDGRRKGSFAAEVDISQAYLSQIIFGHKRPSIEVMARIERASEGAVPLSAWVETREGAA